MLNYEEQFRRLAVSPPTSVPELGPVDLELWTQPSRSRVSLNLFASSVTAPITANLIAPSPTLPAAPREVLVLHTATTSINQVDVPSVRVKSPTRQPLHAASRLTGHAMPPRPIGRRCQDSARQRPRREINCFSSLALSNPFSDFSVVANSHTKRFSFIVLDLTYLLTYWMCVICSQSGFRATASCYTSVL